MRLQNYSCNHKSYPKVGDYKSYAANYLAKNLLKSGEKLSSKLQSPP